MNMLMVALIYLALTPWTKVSILKNIQSLKIQAFFIQLLEELIFSAGFI